MTLDSKKRRSALALLSATAIALLGAACRQEGPQEAQRLRRLETSVTEIPGVMARLQSLEGKEGGMSTQLATLDTTVKDLETKVADFRAEVDASKGASGELKKKADELSGRVNSASAKVDALSGRIAPLEQKISLLQTRYDDHLRKYHSGG